MKDFSILYKLVFSFFLISLYQFIIKLENPLTVFTYALLLFLVFFDIILFLIKRLKKK